MKRFTKKEIEKIGGSGTALVLCGFGPYGDTQSVRYRLDAANAAKAKLILCIEEWKAALPEDEFIPILEREIEIWDYAIREGEKLLKKLLKDPTVR